MPTPWTTPKTWTSATLSSTDMNTHVRDNLNYLKESIPPGAAGSPDAAGVGGAGTSEEWGTTTTGLTWTPSNPTTVDSHTTIPNHLYIANQADATERIGTKAWTPAGAAAFDARLGRVMIGANSSVAAVTSQVCFHIGDSGNANRLMIVMDYTYNSIASTVRAFTYASSTYTQRGGSASILAGYPYYLRITRDGSNNCSFYWSANGLLWNFIATQALTLTVANIGIRVVGNTTAGFQAAADWLRTSV
jgi:hypothetical protein